MTMHKQSFVIQNIERMQNIRELLTVPFADYDLADRERTALEYVVMGYTENEIARQMGVTRRTIGNYKRRSIAVLDAAHPEIVVKSTNDILKLHALRLREAAGL